MDAAPPTPGLAAAKEQMIALAEQAGRVQQQCGLDIVPAEFARGVLKWGLMQVSWGTHTVLRQCCLREVLQGQAAAHRGCSCVTAPLGDHLHYSHQTCMLLGSWSAEGFVSVQGRLLHCRLCMSGPAGRRLRRSAT